MKSYRFQIILILLAGAFLGCSIHTPEPKSPTNENIEVLRFRWKKQLYSNIPNFKIPEFYEMHDRFAPVETAGAAFDTDSKRILVGATVGGFYCLDAFSKETIWRFDLDDPVGSTPYYDSSRKSVFFGADDGYLYRLHARSGRLLWKVDTGAEIKRNIWMKDDTLFLVNADNTVLAIDPEGGEVVWRYRRAPVEGFSSVTHSDIVIEKGLVITGFSDGYVVALDSGTGSIIWEADIAREAVAASQGDEVLLVDVDATPVVIDGLVVASSLAGGTYGLDLASGTVRWSRADVDKVTGAAYLNGEVYLVRSGNQGMVSINPVSGKTILARRFGVGLKADPVPFDDMILVSDSEAGLYIISAGTGRILNLLNMNGGFFARPSEHAGYLVIMGNWSTLFTFSIQ